MRTNDEIIDLVIKLKEENGLSLSELARRVDMAKSGLSRYFNRTRKFPLNKVDVFAEVLGVTPEHILGFDRPAKKKKIDPDAPPKFITKEEKNIAKQLEFLLHCIDEKGNFVAYNGKHPKDMSEDAFENHIILKNSLEEALRIAKRFKRIPRKFNKDAQNETVDQ